MEEDDFMKTYCFPKELREHMDMASKIVSKIEPMKKMRFEKDKLKRTLKRLKNKKAAGPSGLKPEFFKALADNDKCVEILVKCFDNELKRREKPKSWKTSNTKMIPKKKNPTVKDLRPIALTELSYKIFMTTIKNEIEDHLRKNDVMHEAQAGFTKGSKTEDNIFILQYLIEKSFKMKIPLIVICIDFAKAFDSIKST